MSRQPPAAATSTPGKCFRLEGPRAPVGEPKAMAGFVWTCDGALNLRDTTGTHSTRMHKAPPCTKQGGAFVYPVGETGFEPATPASRTQCSTWLSYSPNSPSWSSASRVAARARPPARPADGVGFEPTRAFHPTRFPIVLLKPLGHPSRSLRLSAYGEGGIRTHAGLSSPTV